MDEYVLIWMIIHMLLHRRRNQGALGALAPTKFVSAHRNLVLYNRNMSC